MEFVKRIVPFVLTFVIGMMIAGLFLSLTGQSSTDTSRSWERYRRHHELHQENRRLRRENCRLRWQMRMQERRERMKKNDLIDLVPPVELDK